MNTLGPKLTDYEIEALSGNFNLADGHARYSISQNYASLLERLPQLLIRHIDQEEVEYTFSEVFFGLGRQKPLDQQRILYCPSASISIEIVANYLRMNNLSVSLIEPVFDNLADCIKRHHVPLKPLKEDYLRENDVSSWFREVDTDAIFLVVPNNPTGYLLPQSFFSELVDFCVKEDKLLILDFSFRFFIPDSQIWNQYEILEQSGVRYITIEDTGKTWPTFEIKVSPLVADKHTYSSICSIYRDIFICHSPLALTLVGEFIKTSQEEGLKKSFQTIIDANRHLFRTTISNTPLEPVSYPTASVEWIYIQDRMDDLEMVNRLQSHGIHVLPGRNFFWSNRHASSQFVRVALMRDTDIFASGMNLLQRIIPSLFN